MIISIVQLTQNISEPCCLKAKFPLINQINWILVVTCHISWMILVWVHEDWTNCNMFFLHTKNGEPRLFYTEQKKKSTYIIWFEYILGILHDLIFDQLSIWEPQCYFLFTVSLQFASSRRYHLNDLVSQGRNNTYYE